MSDNQTTCWITKYWGCFPGAEASLVIHLDEAEAYAEYEEWKSKRTADQDFADEPEEHPIHLGKPRTCDSCRHWREAPFDLPTQGPCSSPHVGGWLKSIQGIASASNEDGDVLFTGPKFGCVHWEAIEAT